MMVWPRVEIRIECENEGYDLCLAKEHDVSIKQRINPAFETRRDACKV